jgi:hypothetical protein
MLQVDLDLGGVEQIVEASQVRAIADAIQKSRSFMDGKRTLKVGILAWNMLLVTRTPLTDASWSSEQEVLAIIEDEMDRAGSLDIISVHQKSGFYTRPRKFEVSVREMVMVQCKPKSHSTVYGDL